MNFPRTLARDAHVVVILMVDPYGGEYQFTFDPELIAKQPAEVGYTLMTSYLTAVLHRSRQPAAEPGRPVRT